MSKVKTLTPALNRRLSKRATEFANENGIPISDAVVLVHKAHWDGKTDLSKIDLGHIKNDLSHLSENKNKHRIYAMLEHEAATMQAPLHVITLPNVSTDFEMMLLNLGNVASMTFIERDPQVAEVISDNFKDIPHQLIVGKFPETTQEIHAEYHQSNFIWLDMMGSFLTRYYNEIETLVKTSHQTDMMLAITIGTRGPGATNDPNEVNENLKEIFLKHGWKIESMNMNQYKSSAKMNCLSYRLSNPNNSEKGNELNKLKKKAKKLEKKLAAVNLKIDAMQGSTSSVKTKELTSGQKAWATRIKRYGTLGRRNKEYNLS